MERIRSPLPAQEGDDGYTKDGSVDLKGRPVLRSKKGSWKACSFVVAYEGFEKMAHHGVSSNLVIYLTRKLHQGTVTAANNVTNWRGTGFLMTILGAYVAEAHLGRFWTFSVSAAIYFLGMCLLTMTVSVPPLKPPPPCGEAETLNCTAEPVTRLQAGVFFGALYILALGNAGTRPNIPAIGADQFDDFDPKERAHKLSYFNWWMFCSYLGTLVADVVLIYIQDNVGWSLGYGLPTIGFAVALVIFFAGTSLYRHRVPQGSPFTKMARVVVAATRKWKVSLPEDPSELHELGHEEYAKRGAFRIQSTNSIRFLNKAAVETSSGPKTPWTLCPVTHVEETKLMLRMVPVCIALVVPAAIAAQVHTLFVKQGTTLDRHIGPHFQIPPASLSFFVTVSMLVTIVVYDCYFIRFAKVWTKNPRGITLLQRIGFGLVLHIVIMLVASLAEKKRLRVARDHGVVQKGREVPLTILALLPQYVLMGVAEAFLLIGKIEFFYDQAPDSMKSLGTAYSSAILGFGNFLSSALLKTVANVTSRGGKEGWIMDNLNVSHLDRYYELLAVLGIFNLVLFLFVTKFYAYKAEVFESGEEQEGDHEMACNKGLDTLID